MTYEQFNTSLDQSTPPSGLSVYLQSLWYDGKGNWEQSHETIQDVPDKNASWIHAYLHRKEGDAFNAQYWYSKAGKPMPRYSLDQEWEELVKLFISYA